MRWVMVAAFLVVGFGEILAEGNSNAHSLGKSIATLPLVSLHGKRSQLHDFEGNSAIVVVFLSFDCPVAKNYIPTLNSMAKRYRSKQVAFVGLFANREVKRENLFQKAKEYKICFPVFHDSRLEAAKAFQASHVPMAFVLDSKFLVRYQGRIDDTYFARLKKKAIVSRKDLQVALDEILDGKKVSVAVTQPIGCPILFDRPAIKSKKVTFYRDVLPILQKHCQTCHRPGEVGPFSLLTYKQAVTWGNDIKNYTKTRKMPPWMPSEGVAFREERKLTKKEIATLAAWVDNGMPEGNKQHSPPPRKFTQGWHLGEPDLILEPKEEITIAPDGRDLFRCFVFPTNFKEDKFIAAYEVRPGNRRVVHHTVHFLDTKGRGRRLQERFQKRQRKGSRDYGPGYNSMMGPGFFPPSGDLGGWAPGITPTRFKGAGHYLPAGSDFVVQIHYHRTGRQEKDRTRIGLYFSKSKSCKPIQPLILGGRFLSIPANVSHHRVKGDIWTAQDCTIHNVTPHMHLLGKFIKVTMTPPGGKRKTIIGIADWDYDWQEIYHFKEPIEVKAGTHFHVEAVYDNSANNPRNPNNPPRTVFLGEQTDNEMCFAFFGVTTKNGQPMRVRLWPGGPVIRHLAELPAKKTISN